MASSDVISPALNASRISLSPLALRNLGLIGSPYPEPRSHRRAWISLGYEIPISLDLSDVASRLQEDPHELFLFPSELAESADLEPTVYAGAAVRALQSCHLQLSSNKPGICQASGSSRSIPPR